MRVSLEKVLKDKKILLCLGGGGVGKTTASASIAVAGALRGRRTAVLTIDPARRLKDALRIPELAARPEHVPLERVADLRPGGELTAMMLDAKRTFDELVARFAPNLETAERILHNRLYDYVSGRLAGSQEYMALEKLYEIATGEQYDLLVVDTPPTHHALDFLDAPQRMVDLLASRAVSFLQRPSMALLGAGSRLAQAALETILRTLERFTGLSLLAEVADFVSSFEGMLDGFRNRADAVRRLLRDEKTAVILVTSADPFTVTESVAFFRELRQAGLELGGVVLNRTVPEHVLRRSRRRLRDMPRDLVANLREARRELEALADRDRRMLATLRAEVGEDVPIVCVPDLVEDVSDLGGLCQMAEILAPGSRMMRPPRQKVTALPSRAG